jgi:starch phosphorylase
MISRPVVASVPAQILGSPGANRGTSVADIKQSFVDHLFGSLGRSLESATRNDKYLALALTIRERVFETGDATLEAYRQSRAVAYLSAEYLPGPHLANNVLGLRISDRVQTAMSELGLDYDNILAQEEEPGLGNGGLGRLAACYMDSLATLGLPAIGYGIRYEFGIFQQAIQDGWQVELTDKWLRWGNPWEIVRPEIAYDVQFGGSTETFTDEDGDLAVRWHPAKVIQGVAHDTPILGYGVQTCNRLRLWRAAAVDSFNFAAFNQGDYYGAVADKMYSENITKVLYPNDEAIAGKILRLEQQYFFVSCALQDMIRMQLAGGWQLTDFHHKWAVQLNDTHPSIGVAELMRLLVDEHRIAWDQAWNVTRQTFGYTNHTLLPEALETWPLGIFAQLLPRHLEIIYEINRRFLHEVRGAFPGDDARVARMSLIDEHGGRSVRMANLATVGSRNVNGVSELHSALLQETVLHDFYALWPEKFTNVTNGVTPRRFIALANPPLAALITAHIGDTWLSDLDELRKLEPLADDQEFQQLWSQAKRTAKSRLAAILKERTGVVADPTTLFDVQAKRLHEYKRQHLNALYIIAAYLQLKRTPELQVAPRTFIFGGKAAPGYVMAKLIIKLIDSIGAVVNADPQTRHLLQVAFFPNFNVKNGQHIYPAADLSEQISTAGKEASGTGNMKFSLNGALTIGTLDGANVEIRKAVGAENFFLFGLTAAEVAERLPNYQPHEIYDENPIVREALDYIASGALANGDAGLFRPLVDNLRNSDPFFVLADFQSYFDAQTRVNELWRDQNVWARKSILNVARMGHFSSDRSVREYARSIWMLDAAPSPAAAGHHV